MRHNRTEQEVHLIHLADNSETIDPVRMATSRLAELADRLNHSHSLYKGQFVKWKARIQNRKWPAYGEPVIARGIFAEPSYDPSDLSAASPYFREPLTLVIGHWLDGDFVEFRVDARRFEPFSS